MRLIDADVLLQTIGDVCSSPEFSRGAVKMAVISAETIDAVPVVRCKDCKWKGKLRFCSYDCCTNPNYGMASGVELREDDFCSYGEREG